MASFSEYCSHQSRRMHIEQILDYFCLLNLYLIFLNNFCYIICSCSLVALCICSVYCVAAGLVSWDCHSKVQEEWLKKPEIYCLWFWRLEIQKQRLSARLVPSEGWAGEWVPCLSPRFWWLAGKCWCPLACRSITRISAFLFMWCSPCVHVC